MRYPVIELGGLTGAEDVLVKSPRISRSCFARHVQPGVSVVRLEVWLALSKNMFEHLYAALIAGQRNDDAAGGVPETGEVGARVAGGGSRDEFVERDPVDPGEGMSRPRCRPADTGLDLATVCSSTGPSRR